MLRNAAAILLFTTINIIFKSQAIHTLLILTILPQYFVIYIWHMQEFV